MRSVGVELSTGDLGVQGCGLGWGDEDVGCTRVDDGDETLGGHGVVIGKTVALRGGRVKVSIETRVLR